MPVCESFSEIGPRAAAAFLRRIIMHPQITAMRIRMPTMPPTAPAIIGVLLDSLGAEEDVDVVVCLVALGMNLVAVLTVGVYARENWTFRSLFLNPPLGANSLAPPSALPPITLTISAGTL